MWRDLKTKAYSVWIVPLRLAWADLREVYWFTKGLFR